MLGQDGMSCIRMITLPFILFKLNPLNEKRGNLVHSTTFIPFEIF